MCRKSLNNLTKLDNLAVPFTLFNQSFTELFVRNFILPPAVREDAVLWNLLSGELLEL
jgi:hypothetical protein